MASLDLSRISGIDLIAKEVRYHHSCRRSYIQRASRYSDGRECSPKMSSHSQAFEQLDDWIQHSLIDNEGAMSLASLHKRYLDLLDDKE